VSLWIVLGQIRYDAMKFIINNNIIIFDLQHTLFSVILLSLMPGSYCVTTPCKVTLYARTYCKPLACTAVSLWNNLPQEALAADSISSFKSLVYLDP